MEMGGYGGPARADRALQARYLCRGDPGLSRAGEMSGKKPKKAPVVMIHGAFAGPWVWDGFGEKFRAAGYQVHAPCLRHHDKPSASLGQTGLGDFAGDLELFLDGL